MSSLSPPAKKLWWNEPIHKSELLWITLVFVWGLVMTFMMPYWHVVGKQNLGTETYKTTPAKFQEATQAFVDKFTVRTEGPRNHPGSGAAGGQRRLYARPPVGLVAHARTEEG